MNKSTDERIRELEALSESILQYIQTPGDVDRLQMVVLRIEELKKGKAK